MNILLSNLNKLSQIKSQRKRVERRISLFQFFCQYDFHQFLWFWRRMMNHRTEYRDLISIHHQRCWRKVPKRIYVTKRKLETQSRVRELSLLREILKVTTIFFTLFVSPTFWIFSFNTLLMRKSLRILIFFVVLVTRCIEVMFGCTGVTKI